VRHLKCLQYQFESDREYHFGSHALTGVCDELLTRDSAGFDSQVILHYYCPVAQLGEHLLDKRKVVGSKPTRTTISVSVLSRF
jgi:hypothetical protein